MKKVFYSWQSDDQKAKGLLRTAISSACKNLDCARDEAVRGSSGAISIPEEIEKKIKEASVFIADVSIVSRDLSSNRAFPNPNVLYELGVASNSLGWHRIILAMNASTGEIDSLPFDIRHHRVMRIEYGSGSALAKEIEDAISTCLRADIQDFLAFLSQIDEKIVTTLKRGQPIRIQTDGKMRANIITLANREGITERRCILRVDKVDTQWPHVPLFKSVSDWYTETLFIGLLPKPVLVNDLDFDVIRNLVGNNNAQFWMPVLAAKQM